MTVLDVDDAALATAAATAVLAPADLHQRLDDIAETVYLAVDPIVTTAESLDQVADELASVLFAAMETAAVETDASLFRVPDLGPWHEGGPGRNPGEVVRIKNTIAKILNDQDSRESPGVRIDRLIRNELARAEREQVIRSAKVRGITHYVWHSIPESCEACEDQAGKPIPIEVPPKEIHA